MLNVWWRSAHFHGRGMDVTSALCTARKLGHHTAPFTGISLTVARLQVNFANISIREIIVRSAADIVRVQRLAERTMRPPKLQNDQAVTELVDTTARRCGWVMRSIERAVE